MAKWHRKLQVPLRGRKALSLARGLTVGLALEAAHGSPLPSELVQGSDPRLRPATYYTAPGGFGEGGGDPGNIYYWTTLFKRSDELIPLLDADGNMNLLPDLGKEVIAGDRNTGGLHRPVVIADQAYQTRASQEYLKVAGAPVLSAALATGINWDFYPVNTDPTRAFTGVQGQLNFSGANLVDPNSQAWNVSLNFSGSANFSDPGAVNQPPVGVDINVHFGTNFTGNVPKAAGMWLHPLYWAGATGTVPRLDMIRGAAGGIATAGKITDFSWLTLPNLINVTNFYLARLGLGTILAEGNLTFLANAADITPLAVKLAASQTADAFQILDSADVKLLGVACAGGLDICSGALDLRRTGGPNRIEIGSGQTSNQYAYIDFIGDTTYTDYGLRLIRYNTGANARSALVHRGTGDFEFSASEAANLEWLTSNTVRMILSGASLRVGDGTLPTSTLHVGGSFAVPMTSVLLMNYTVTATDYLVLVTTGPPARTISLPTAVGITGRVYVIKKIDSGAGAVTIDPSGTETIDGAATLSLASQWARAAIMSDGANWQRVD